MSVRTHTWTTKGGEERKAYLVQYSVAELDSRGKRKRHVKFFDRKKDADTFHAQVRVDVGKGVHVPASKSVTVEAAGRGWIDSCGDLERTTVDGYQQHLNLHIVPYLGGVKLSALTVAIVRDWQDKLRKGVPAPGQTEAEPRAADMVKRVTTSLGSVIADAVERGHAGTNAVRNLRASRKRGKERKAERRAKGRLKVGVDIPTPNEIDAILAAAKGRWRPFLLVGDTLRFARVRTARPPMVGCRLQKGRASRSPARRRLWQDWCAQVGSWRAHRPDSASYAPSARGMETDLPAERAQRTALCFPERRWKYRESREHRDARLGADAD